MDDVFLPESRGIRLQISTRIPGKLTGNIIKNVILIADKLLE